MDQPKTPALTNENTVANGGTGGVLPVNASNEPQAPTIVRHPVCRVTSLTCEMSRSLDMGSKGWVKMGASMQVEIDDPVAIESKELDLVFSTMRNKLRHELTEQYKVHFPKKTEVVKGGEDKK